MKPMALPVGMDTGRLWDIPIKDDHRFEPSGSFVAVIPAKSWYTITTPGQGSWWVLVRMDLEGWAR